MPVETKSLVVKSKPDLDIINITEQVSEIVKKSNIKEGIVTLFVKGSTASVSTIEFEPNLVRDMKEAMERLVPSDIRYHHHDNGKSHVRATLMGPGISVPFKDKKLLLGQWQQVVLMDFDVPARDREIILQIIGD